LKLAEAATKLFELRRVRIVQIPEGFRRETRNFLIRDARVGCEGVADAEAVVPNEADDVTRICLIHRLAFVAEKFVRARQAHLLLGARVMHRHVTLEFARTNTDERDAVAMLRVHICLYLEDEPREPRMFRRYFHAGHHARPGWRRMFQEPVEQK